MNSKEKMIQSAITAFLTLATANAVGATASDVAQQEKCYGIVKTGVNDCATGTHSCAGSATKDGQPDTYLLMPTGLCEKIVGGSVKPKAEKKG